MFDKFSGIKKEEMCKEYTSIKYDYNKPIIFLKPQSGKYLNINSDGFRGSRLDLTDDDNYRIFFLGGSTAFGIISSTDDTTIPALLEKKLHTDGFSVKVINAGVPSFTTRDELYYIEHHILNYKPDLIIMYDGWNDISHINEVGRNISYEKFSLNTSIENSSISHN